MSADRAVCRLVAERRSILSAHVAMLVEAGERGEPMDAVQLDLLLSEMVHLRELGWVLYLADVSEQLATSDSGGERRRPLGAPSVESRSTCPPRRCLT